MNILTELFTEHFGEKPNSIEKLKGAGSNRIYYRLNSNKHKVIGVVGESKQENETFIRLAKHFSSKKLPTPQVFIYSEDYLHYLQDDLGDTALFDYTKNGISRGIFSEQEKQMLHKTIALLPKLQFEAAKDLDFSICYPQAEFDQDTIMWDLNYFKYCFLKTTGVDFLEPKLEDDFRKLAKALLKTQSNTFLYRDFQARNVMIKDNKPYFIDFQGGRKGPIFYDVASFIWQAKANYPQDLKTELIETYLEALKPYQNVSKVEFYKQLELFVFFRTLQVLGAYGFRGYFEKKKHFIESIPFAIKNLSELIVKQAHEYPYLCEILIKMCNQEKFKMKTNSPIDNSKLTLSINSFSYKKGIPEDNSGNGGGYVFDCRGMNNPGRYEDYKQLTGLQKPVIDFLEKEGEVTRFLEAVYLLAEAHVEDFLRRGFTNLMFNFGCTGGQHRSVYSAQHLAEHLHNKYGVKIILNHREQNIHQEFQLQSI